MATPLTPDRILAALKNEGVKVIEHSGWRTHNRNHKGDWGPVHGVMIHHTVTGPKVNAVPICHDGYADLPGPLCHGVIRRDGTVHLISAGRANHAGAGDPAVLKAVTNESYTTRPPAPTKHQGSIGAVDGNAHFYGFECENLGDGKDPWPPAQLEAIIRASTALAKAHGWTEKSVIGHSEWSDWKSDPKGPGMPSMTEVRRRIAIGLKTGGPTTPKPQPKPTEEKPMTISDADLKRIAQAEWNYRNPIADKASVEAGLGRIPDAYAYLVRTNQVVNQLADELAALRRQLDNLTKTIKANP